MKKKNFYFSPIFSILLLKLLCVKRRGKIKFSASLKNFSLTDFRQVGAWRYRHLKNTTHRAYNQVELPKHRLFLGRFSFATPPLNFWTDGFHLVGRIWILNSLYKHNKEVLLGNAYINITTKYCTIATDSLLSTLINISHLSQFFCYWNARSS